jgi:hypothetical protein
MNDNERNLEVLTIKLSDKAMQLIINSTGAYSTAGEIMLSLKDTEKKIKDYWKDPKEKSHQAHKAITEKENQMLKPVQTWIKTLNGKISNYLTDQENKRKEEQKKLDEQRRKEEQAEKEKLEKKAKKAELKGDIEKSEHLKEMAQSVYVPPAIVESQVENKMSLDSGTVLTKEDIDIDIIDALQVIKGIASGQLPIGIISINESKLKQYIKSFNLVDVPGCIILKKVSAQFRGK